MIQNRYSRMGTSLMIGFIFAILMSGQAFSNTTENAAAIEETSFVTNAQIDVKGGPGSIRLTTVGESGEMPQETILGGATLTMLQSQTESQILSAIIETK